jgi:hypothetical protein
MGPHLGRNEAASERTPGQANGFRPADVAADEDDRAPALLFIQPSFQ